MLRIIISAELQLSESTLTRVKVKSTDVSVISANSLTPTRNTKCSIFVCIVTLVFSLILGCFQRKYVLNMAEDVFM